LVREKEQIEVLGEPPMAARRLLDPGTDSLRSTVVSIWNAALTAWQYARSRATAQPTKTTRDQSTRHMEEPMRSRNAHRRARGDVLKKRRPARIGGGNPGMWIAARGV